MLIGVFFVLITFFLFSSTLPVQLIFFVSLRGGSSFWMTRCAERWLRVGLKFTFKKKTQEDIPLYCRTHNFITFNNPFITHLNSNVIFLGNSLSQTSCSNRQFTSKVLFLLKRHFKYHILFLNLRLFLLTFWWSSWSRFTIHNFSFESQFLKNSGFIWKNLLQTSILVKFTSNDNIYH